MKGNFKLSLKSSQIGKNYNSFSYQFSKTADMKWLRVALKSFARHCILLLLTHFFTFYSLLDVMCGFCGLL